MQFSYEVIIKDTVIISMMNNMEEDMYRFIRPLCELWLVFEIFRERFLIPCGPIFSCHPRSIVRDEKNREEVKDIVEIIL